MKSHISYGLPAHTLCSTPSELQLASHNRCNTEAGADHLLKWSNLGKGLATQNSHYIWILKDSKLKNEFDPHTRLSGKDRQETRDYKRRGYLMVLCWEPYRENIQKDNFFFTFSPGRRVKTMCRIGTLNELSKPVMQTLNNT